MGEPSDVAIFSSMEVTFTCTFEGIPLPSISWSYSRNISTTLPSLVQQGGRFDITTMDLDASSTNYTVNVTLSTLTLTAAMEEDAGIYICTATNAVMNFIGAQPNATAQLFFMTNGNPGYLKIL